MNRILEAALCLKDTLIIIPLIPICFAPVWPYIRSTPRTLCIRIFLSVLFLEAAMFAIYMVSTSENTIGLTMLITVGFFFFLYQREVDLSRFKLWFVFVTACLIGSFSYLVYHITEAIFYPTNVPAGSAALLPYGIQQAFAWAMTAICFYPTKKYLGWLVREFQTEKIWQVVWILPAIFTMFSWYFIPYDNRNVNIGRVMKMYILVVFFFLAMILTIYVLFYRIAYSIVENQNMMKKAALLEIQAEQYRNLRNHMQETNRIRHDFRHQLAVLTAMLKNREYEEMEKYLETYTSRISDTIKHYCPSHAVNALLSHYASLAGDQSIASHFKIRVSDPFPVDEMDFCVLLGNLLENAVHACIQLPEKDREITLKIGQTAAHTIALEITNPYSGSVRKQNGRFLSSKHNGYGQGLDSVRMITEKYQGLLEIHHENQIFLVRILLHF